MEGHARTLFTPKQRAELWERWRSGQCVADIARALERRNKRGVYRAILPEHLPRAQLSYIDHTPARLLHFGLTKTQTVFVGAAFYS